MGMDLDRNLDLDMDFNLDFDLDLLRPQSVNSTQGKPQTRPGAFVSIVSNCSGGQGGSRLLPLHRNPIWEVVT